MTTREKIDDMLQRYETIEAGGGAKRVAKQHDSGKMTARERINSFLDQGSFVELDKFVEHRCSNFGQEKKYLPGDGVVTGYGTVNAQGPMMAEICGITPEERVFCLNIFPKPARASVAS